MEFLVLLAFPMVACGCFPGHRSDLSSGLLALTLTTLPRQAETELFNDMFSFMWHVASMLSFASEDIYDQYRYHLSTMKKIVPPECVTAGLPHPRTVDEVSKTPVPQLMLSALDLVQAWITASEDLPLPGLVPHRVFNYYSLLFLLEQGIQSYVKRKEETCDLPTYKRFYLNDDTVHLQVANSDLLYCLKTDMLRVLTYLRLSYCATTDMC
ncbi:somatotropin-like isoform X3 [Tachyglossus aculeatus]|uniref:somatotropin-like isoform X3 n=1 Tax=Tachyglossus aculeatus TaxID=9261 RepID=UPI0018F74D3D|nr:somatotropin-like isoform X3 [Tachyglossus aculeatus]